MNLATCMMLLTTFTVLSTGTRLLSNSEAYVYVQLLCRCLNAVLGKKRLKEYRVRKRKQIWLSSFDFEADGNTM